MAEGMGAAVPHTLSMPHVRRGVFALALALSPTPIGSLGLRCPRLASAPPEPFLSHRVKCHQSFFVQVFLIEDLLYFAGCEVDLLLGFNSRIVLSDGIVLK